MTSKTYSEWGSYAYLGDRPRAETAFYYSIPKQLLDRMLAQDRRSKLTLFLCFLQIYAISSCTFLPVYNDFNATMDYEMALKNEDSCLTACLQDPTCTFIKYSGNLCTIYKEGIASRHSALQAKDAGVYELDRQMTTEQCSRKVSSDSIVEYDTEPGADDSELKKCRAWQDC